MEEDKFDEQFPELIDYKQDIDCEQCALEYGHIVNYTPRYGIRIGAIKRHCLSKQKVLEVLHNIPCLAEEVYIIAAIKHELGLEDV